MERRAGGGPNARPADRENHSVSFVFPPRRKKENTRQFEHVELIAAPERAIIPIEEFTQQERITGRFFRTTFCSTDSTIGKKNAKRNSRQVKFQLANNSD